MPLSFYFRAAKERGSNSNPGTIQFISVFLLLFTSLFPLHAVCEDNLQAVMARMKPEIAVSINYQENRYLSLMSEKWSGAGSFYAQLPDVMIKEQQRPEKELMAIKGSELYYFNQDSGQKHQGDMDVEDNLAVQTAAFKGLMNGDLAFLQTLYDIHFASKPTGWTITLTAKKNAASENGAKVVMQGLPDKVANKLELIMADGDRMEYTLTPALSGEQVKLKIKALLDLLGAS